MMLKTQRIFILTCKVKNNVLKSAFRNASQIDCKSNAYIYFRHKCFLQHSSIFNFARRSWLSKLTNVSLIKDPSTLTDSFLDGICDGDDPERKDEMLNIVKLLVSHGCSEEDIKNKCLPVIRFYQGSYLKVKLLTELHFNTAMLLPLLACHIVTIETAAKNAHRDHTMGFPNRIEYLSCSLKIKPIALIPKFLRNPSLLNIPFETLQSRMKILKQAKISSEYIAKDHWILNYNEKLLENRITAALNAEVELKPWMLRCSKKFFESILSKRAQTQSILKGDDEINYLAKKLDCSEDYVKVMMDKNKLLKTINIPKIELVLNFLFDKGYTTQEVRLFPRVFCSSVETLSKRFEGFQRIKTTIPTLSQLCLSSKRFETRTKKSLSKEKRAEMKENN